MIPILKTINPARVVSHLLRRAVALALVLALIQAPALLAQVSGISAARAGAPMALHIVILDGDGALNNIRQRTAREPIVEVQDENHKPVAGATVLFTIHAGVAGAAGTFAGVATFAAVTGLDGQAVATGLKPNLLRGQYTITVQASVGAVATSAIITQTNVIGVATTASAASKAALIHHGGLFGGHFWIVAGGIAAAGGAIATTILVTRTNGASITPGTGTVKP